MRTKSIQLRGSLITISLVVLAFVLINYAPSTDARAGAGNAAEPGIRTVLITGANRGIGLELARQYSAAGWRVIGTARRPDAAEDLRSTGAEVMQLDVTDQDSVDQLAKELIDRPVDLLINNAGIQPLMWTLADIDFDEFERAFSVNATGPVRVSRALLPNLRSGKKRTVINVTTNLSSIHENTDGGFYGYRESKAALNMFTRSLAIELGPEDFICIVLHPGWVQTDLGGPKAPLTVQESVQGMRRVIEDLLPADNGSFLTYDGKKMAW
jgi:NAD(P)-dependent dehydrogenase (short-subunit alcohol dehydrogenase family)